jgi:hypothetical protein
MTFPAEEWRKRGTVECNERAAAVMGGSVQTHILAQWVSGQGRGADAELTLFEDGSIQLMGTAPVELLTHVQAEWYGHLKGKIA